MLRGAIVALGFISTILVASAAAVAAEGGFAWQEAEGDHVDLLYNGQPAIRYMRPTLDESNADTRNATFKPWHNVYSPDGQTLLTQSAGGKLYSHHRGIFYGFNKITYGDGKHCDTWHCTGKAFQSHEKVLKSEANPKSAWHRVAVDWHGEQGEVFAHEKRTVRIKRATQNDVEGWLITFASKLETADGKPIHLDGDPQHAGFHFRASSEVPDKTAKQTYYLRVDGKGEEGATINWDPKTPDSADSKRAVNRPWNAMSIVVGDKRYTVLYLDHPDNPKPARYSERDYGRIGSYFVADVTKEKPLKVKYRLWIQDGEMTVEQCENLYQEFTDAKASTASPSLEGRG